MHPKNRPSSQVSPLRHSGRARAAGAAPTAAALRSTPGATSAKRRAASSTGTDHAARLASGELPTSGSTTGAVSATGMTSPMSRPLE
jgi:hypothetical protein